jgi:hypothetical protein
VFISWPNEYINTVRLSIIILSLFGFANLLSNITTIPEIVYSQPCAKKCIISNPFTNNVQTWADNTNNIKIEFSRSPIFPFVGNVTQLNFSVTSLNPNEQLELTHIHITLIKNLTATFNNNNIINNKNNFITFDNLTAAHGVFSLKYRFLEAGAHQIIFKIITKDGKVALGSFNIPVLKFWWNLF